MKIEYQYFLLCAAIFLIFFIKTGKYLDSASYGVAIAYILVFLIAHFQPIKVITNNNNFDGANVKLIVREQDQ